MTISYDDIKNICTEFVNDSDTTIGIECMLTDYLVKEVILDCKTKDELCEALNVSRTDYAIPIEVHHEKYGDMEVYLALCDNGFIVSTKEWLLNADCE